MSNDLKLISSGQATVEHFDWGQLHWYASSVLSGATGCTVGRCILKPGYGNPIHYHPNCEEVLHVLSGNIEHYIRDKGWFAMNPGDTITIPANLSHGARNIGQSEAHLLICFSSAERQTIGESR